MWYCQKCNKWYEDSVTILKHFQTLHTLGRNNASLSKMKMHIMKPTLTKLVVKKKPKSSQMPNGTQSLPSHSNQQLGIIRKDKPAEVLKTHNATMLPFDKKLQNSEKRSPLDQFMTINRSYICKFCCRKFQDGNDLKLHLKTHQSNPQHSCHLCGLTASTFSALMAHYVRHSGLKSQYDNNAPAPAADKVKKVIEKRAGLGIPCDQCKKTFLTRKAFNVHYCPPLEVKSEYVCAYCRHVTATVEEYRDHIQSHSPALQFACTLCTGKFGHKFQLEKHLRTCHDTTVNKPPAKTAKGASKPVKSPVKSKSVQHNIPKRRTRVRCKQKTNNKVPKLKLPSTSLHALPDVKTEICEVELPKGGLGTSEPIADHGVMPSLVTDAMKHVELPSAAVEIHSRLRPKKKKVTYASESSSDDASAALPTRRSARLVNKSPIRHSFSESESIDPEDFHPEDTPTNSGTISLSSSNTASPKKTPVIRPIKQEPDKSPSHEINEPLSANPELVFKISRRGPKKGSSPNAAIVKRKQKAGRVPDSEKNMPLVLCCNLCSLMFRSVGSLKRHKKMHSGKPQFVCQYCGKFFYRRDIHRRHEGNVHMVTEFIEFICYYCKGQFDTSENLMEHSVSVHSNKASAPERIRHCTPSLSSKFRKPEKNIPDGTKSVKKSSAVIDLKKVKEEIEELSSYTCGKCKKSFNSSPSLVLHFDKVHGTSSNNNNKVTAEQESNVHTKTLSTSIEEAVDREMESIERTISAPQEEPDTVANVDEHEHSNSLDADIAITWQKTDDSCELCFLNRPERGLMMCGEHKAIDFYQCSMCSFVGHKRQMEEHMLKHMTKIGTFIVNVNDHNINQISDFLGKQNHTFSEPTALEVDNLMDCVSSVCTLMKEVPCCRCSEVIVDFHLLLQHPCMNSDDGTYTCIVKDCCVTCNNLVEMQNHLRFCHYEIAQPEQQ